LVFKEHITDGQRTRQNTNSQYTTVVIRHLRRNLSSEQDKISHCTKLQVLQETVYPDSYYKVGRFFENIEDDSEKVPGSIYHD
jgi:endonuclease III-like uncharacterized protein